jgi:hypothetical protein
VSGRRAVTLHVTNGDAVLYLFGKAGIAGTHLAWRDALHEGPVPPGLSLEETSAVRAEYHALRGYGKPIKVNHEFARRDALLRSAETFEEVVLWFEHDLFDQLQLLQILTALETLELDPGRVSIVQSDRYLGTMTADELSPLLARRRTVTAATFTSARRAWERFRSPDPSQLFASAREEAIGLPHLRSAMARLCEEYPWVGDGLSRTQRHALQAVAQGPGTPAELFRRAQDREEVAFLPDRQFAATLDDLERSAAPLIEGAENELVPTALGRRVLAGDADWIADAGIDRWIGGVHLTATAVPRWEPDAGALVLPPE